MKIANPRYNYGRQSLHRAELHNDPFKQFEIWLAQAIERDPLYANAMSIATVSASGMPSVRTVLLKSFDQRGFIFYSNRHSQKGQELADNPQAALLFHWSMQEQQVRISGSVEELCRDAVDKYFASRPKDSQISALISRQSHVVDSRQQLQQLVAEQRQKLGNSAVELPDDWTGYCVIPKQFEYWQGQADRLHDRFQYNQTADNQWSIQRLAP